MINKHLGVGAVLASFLCLFVGVGAYAINEVYPGDEDGTITNSANGGNTDSSVDLDMFVSSNITISFPTSIKMDVDPAYDGINTAEATLKIKTNNEDGYVATFSTGLIRTDDTTNSTDLKHKSVSDARIYSLTEDTSASNFPRGRWGYSLDGGNTYKGFTAYNDDDIFLWTSDHAGEDDPIDFTFGVRPEETQTAGNYTSTILVAVVANYNEDPVSLKDIKYMQDMTQEVCANTRDLTQKQLVDRRDGKLYWVGKMPDGFCWMTQNLDFDIASTGTTVTPEDTNVFMTKTLVNEDKWVNQYRTFVWDLGNRYNVDGVPRGESLYYGDARLGSDAGQLTDYNGNPLPEARVDASLPSASRLSADDEQLHYHLGNYYTWAAITAGSGTPDLTFEDAKESLCPKGWRLPTSYSSYYVSTLDGYGYGDHFIGGRDDGLPNYSYVRLAGSLGYATRGSTSYYNLASDPMPPGSLTPFYVNFWNYVYCYSYSESSFYCYVSTGPNMTMSWSSYTAYTSYDPYNSTISESYVYPYLFSFNFSNTYYYSLSGSTSTSGYMYPARCVSTKNDLGTISTMQEITPEIVENTQAMKQYQLTDTRDGKKYWVAKLLDGDVWMSQNLDFEISGSGTELVPETSDVRSSKTLIANTFGTNESGNNVFYQDGGDYMCDGSSSGYSFNCSKSELAGETGHTASSYWLEHVGSYYSWNAATAGSGESTTTGEEADESICPKGWRLPIVDEDTTKGYNYKSVAEIYKARDAQTVSYSHAAAREGGWDIPAGNNAWGYYGNSSPGARPINQVATGLIKAGDANPVSEGKAISYWTARRVDENNAEAYYASCYLVGTEDSAKCTNKDYTGNYSDGEEFFYAYYHYGAFDHPERTLSTSTGMAVRCVARKE